MRQHAFLWVLVLLIYAITGVHYVAQLLRLYWTWWWLDSMMHLVSGLWIGLAVVWLVHHSPYRERFARIHAVSPLVLALSTTLMLGVLWEGYQLLGHLYFEIPFKDGHLADSIGDVLFGMLGGSAAIGLYRLAIPPPKPVEEVGVF